VERNIKLTVAYDGTKYHGFQRQANALAVQQVLEERLKGVFGHALSITASGRTDTGVHAYGQVLNFYTTGSIPTERIVSAASGVLPEDIVVVAAEEVNKGFHARRDAKRKTYMYRIYNSRLPNPFELRYAWHVRTELDESLMNTITRQVVGTHDFSAFKAAGGPPVSPIKTIFSANCSRQEKLIQFTFTGSGFLYHMVRNLVGTIVEIGSGRRGADEFARILASHDRRKAGATAPPQGLYLMCVEYE